MKFAYFSLFSSVFSSKISRSANRVEVAQMRPKRNEMTELSVCASGMFLGCRVVKHVDRR